MPFWVLVVSSAFLALGSAAVLWRLVKGPTLMDRVLASDVLLAIVAAAICLDMAWQGRTHYMVLTAMVSLVGFLTTITFAGFILPRSAPSEDR